MKQQQAKLKSQKHIAPTLHNFCACMQLYKAVYNEVLE